MCSGCQYVGSHHEINVVYKGQDARDLSADRNGGVMVEQIVLTVILQDDAEQHSPQRATWWTEDVCF